jgi:nitrogen fixation NifU-like protein
MRYSQTLVDHFLNPRNTGPMRQPDAVAEAAYAPCGDLARFYLRVLADRVTEVRFQAYGCGPTVTAASTASDLVTGSTVEALAAVTSEAVERALGGLPDDRKHAAEIVATALRKAAVNYIEGSRLRV